MKRLPLISWFLIAALLGTLTTSVLGQTEASKKYALVVGINKYHHDNLPDLPYAVNDARELASVLTRAGYEVVLLTDDTGKGDKTREPTRDNIERELKKMLDRCRPKKG